MGYKARKTAQEPEFEETTEFLNVDLCMESSSDLSALVDALGDMDVMHASTEAPFVANLEISPLTDMDIEMTMEALVSRIEDLDLDARRLWDQCSVRRFDIGVQSGLEPQCSEYRLPASLMQRIAATGGEVLITVYGARYE